MTPNLYTATHLISSITSSFPKNISPNVVEPPDPESFRILPLPCAGISPYPHAFVGAVDWLRRMYEPKKQLHPVFLTVENRK